jgi:hypothetical protein
VTAGGDDPGPGVLRADAERAVEAANASLKKAQAAVVAAESAVAQAVADLEGTN